MLVHGSNAQPREAVELWARYFAGLGFAVLGFDKRGTGRSTGDWKAQAPIEIAFMVVHAGTGTTVQEQGILYYRNELRFAGLPDSAVAIGAGCRILSDSVTRTGSGCPALQRYHEAHGAEVPGLEPPAPADAWFRPYYRMLMGYDPRASWERVTCPVLLFFGELDASVPPAESWPPIEQALRRARNSQVTQYVLPKGNHVLLEARTGNRHEYPALRRFVPGYFDRMAQWPAANAR